ncbi:MAG: GerMN domain-containing protein [Clostridia bacterium]|nr:GerMN domain-containing protein [Clostridia bacterium]
MKKIMLMLAALLLAATLSSCRSADMPIIKEASTAAPGTDAAVPSLQAKPSGYHGEEVMLYYRYYDEPCLAAESRAIQTAPDRPYELAVVAALLEGPVSRGSELTSLFPEGTRVLSTAMQGRTLFVTLSREIMNGYRDEPAAWQSDAYWGTEVPLRRQLTMQSLVATVTENCEADRVQVLVEQDETSMADSLRLKQSYFMTGEEGLTEPLTRDEALLLSPVQTMETVMELWQAQDWQRMYRYMAGSGRSDLADFITRMGNLPRVIRWEVSGGSVTADGTACTLTVVLTTSARVEPVQFAFRLVRENNLWKLPQEQLIIRQEAMN